MDKSQKSRDRKMRRLSNSRTERVKCIIKDLEHHGPAGLIHISVLSNIIGKSIKIWNADNSLKRIIGKERTGPTINIEYHTNDLGGIGHWTLMQDKDPDNTEFDLNSCLFSVIGSQTGLNPLELRKWTVLRIKSNLRQLTKRLDEILGSKGTNNEVLMIGGARYCGTSAAHAKIILNNSQNAKPYVAYREEPNGDYRYRPQPYGHPRGHASHPSAIGFRNSAENFSEYRLISAFLSRADQDIITHLSLITDYGRNAIERLNQGGTNITIKLGIFVLERFGDCPSRGADFFEGQKQREEDIDYVTLVLRHYETEFGNRNADVMVHTCYPVLFNDFYRYWFG